LLYELLTGKTPFDATELMAQGIDAMRKTIREKEPVRPSTRLTQELVAASRQSAADSGKDKGGALPSRRYGKIEELIRLLRGDLDWTVMKCLEKDRSRRYETANGLAADIKRHLSNEAVVARPPSAAYKFEKAWCRNKVLYTSGLAVGVALLTGAAISTWQAGVARRAQRAAETAARSAEQQPVLAQHERVQTSNSTFPANQRTKP
jgi:hypothetical protein